MTLGHAARTRKERHVILCVPGVFFIAICGGILCEVGGEELWRRKDASARLLYTFSTSSTAYHPLPRGLMMVLLFHRIGAVDHQENFADPGQSHSEGVQLCAGSGDMWWRRHDDGRRSSSSRRKQYPISNFNFHVLLITSSPCPDILFLSNMTPTDEKKCFPGEKRKWKIIYCVRVEIDNDIAMYIRGIFGNRQRILAI